MKNGTITAETVSTVHCSIIRFVRTREHAMRAQGIEPLQYQFLALLELACTNGSQPNISAVANRLGMHHHSAVELVDRLVERGLVQRKRGKNDRRHVFLHVTAQAKKLLRKVAEKEHADVCQFAPELLKGLKRVLNGQKRSASAH